jgi:hypothetical protein
MLTSKRNTFLRLAVDCIFVKCHLSRRRNTRRLGEIRRPVGHTVRGKALIWCVVTGLS